MKLEALLQEEGIAYEKHTHATTYTAQRLAQAEGVSGYLVAKPVVVKSTSGYAMCVVPAPKNLDLEKVAEVLDEPAVRLATEEELAEQFPDCELGAEPPVGAVAGMTTIMDEKLDEDEYLIMQAGTHTEAIKIRREDWEELCDPIIASITMG